MSTQSKAERMRHAFDGAFALPSPGASPESEDVLAVRAGGDAYALRVREVGGLAAVRRVAPLPGAPAAFLGLTGLRGALVPVWDLAALLGYGGSREDVRCLVLGPGGAPWALAFDGFEGYFRLPRAALAAAETGAFARETCRAGGAQRPILSLPLILDAVRKISQSSSQARREP